MISSLLSALGKCFSSSLFSLSVVFIRLCGKVWRKVQLKDEKDFFNHVILGHADTREVAED